MLAAHRLFSCNKKDMPKPQPMLAPPEPVEEAGIDLGDEEGTDKKKKGKASLKIPLATESLDTGVRV